MTAPSGYYICYEDTDSRVLPYYSSSGMVTAPYTTKLEATQELLAYFEEMRDNLDRCLANTKDELQKLEQGGADA
jgi:hypothetical protein